MHADVIVCVCVSSSAGGMLPVLAQQWLSDLWRVHSEAVGGGTAGRLCAEDLHYHTLRRLLQTHYTGLNFVCYSSSGPLQSGSVQQVSQFHITNWAPDGSCANLKTVSSVVDEMTKVQRKTGNHPIAIHCR